MEALVRSADGGTMVVGDLQDEEESGGDDLAAFGSRPQKRQLLVDQVYETVAEALYSGTLSPGIRLSVPDLARRLGVSRSPVREAIIRLEREGLARAEANRGAAVATFQYQDFAEIYDLREVVEGLAARKAAGLRSENDIAVLEALLADHERAVRSGDLEKHMEYDLAFHTQVAEISRNRRAIELLDRLQSQIRLALATTAQKPGNPDMAIKEHKAILAGIRDGDEEAAETAARQHLQRVKQSLPR